MAGNNNSSSGTNRMAVPEAKDAMKRFKEEVASELGVPLKDGYNGGSDFQTGRFYWWRNGQEDDHEAGRTDEIRTFCRKTKQRMAFDRPYAVFIIGNKKTLGKYVFRML